MRTIDGVRHSWLWLGLLVFLDSPLRAESERASLATPPPDPSSYAHQSILAATAQDLALAMDIPAGDIVSASIETSDPAAVGVGDSALGDFFPVTGGTFAVLASGLASTAEVPNTSGSTSTILNGLNNSQGNDMTRLRLRLRKPAGATCLNFHFAFYSEEFPEWVGSQYNDAFTAEMGGTDLQIINNQVVAPRNFAFDSGGNLISVNTVFGYTLSSGTTYDGRTPLLLATTPLEGQSNEVEIVLTIQDLGDSIYDSAVFFDDFFWGYGVSCTPGAYVDSDGDSLLDDWETNGIDIDNDGTIDLDLPAMGADPLHKDIFVEIDYMVDPGWCLFGICIGSHTHKPKAAAMALVIDAFDHAPVANPDGTTGIHLHADSGPDSVMDSVTGATWGARSQSEALAHSDTLGYGIDTNNDGTNDTYIWTDFDSIKGAGGVPGHLSIVRRDVFHYVIFAHDLGGFVGTSGISRDIPDSDLVVSLGSWTGKVGTVNEQGGTFMHELGHNLSLRHGGSDHTNYKPNFLSVMNYSFQTRGLRINGVDGNFDYSRFLLPVLNEASLNEVVGLNGGAAIASYGTRYFCGGANTLVNNANGCIDWNCDGACGGTVSANINASPSVTLSVLTSYNDWDYLVFNGGAIGKLGQDIERPAETEVIDISRAEDGQIPTLQGLKITAPDNRMVARERSAQYSFTVANIGEAADTYELSAYTSLGWADIAMFPTTVTVGAGEGTTVNVTVQVPAGTSITDVDELSLKAVSMTNLMSDSGMVSTSVSPNQPPVANAGGPYSVEEGGAADLQGTGEDPDGDALAFAWDLDGDGVFETPGQTVSFSAAVLDGPATATVRLQVSDPSGETSVSEAIVSVLNAAPSANASFQAETVSCGSNNAVLEVTFTDQCLLDTHQAIVDWGDGSEPLTLDPAVSPLQLGHTYARAGIYNATVTVTDDDGGSGADALNSLAVFLTVEGGGVLPPLNQDGSSVYKYKSTVPVKVRLADCDGSYPADLAPTIQLKLISGALPSQTINEPVSTSAADTTGMLRFDPLANQYIYNLATKLLPDPSATYEVSVAIPRTGQVVKVKFGLRP